MNSRYTFGGCSNFGNTTIPFRTSFRLTFLSAKEADWPAEQTGTDIRFLSMERILVVVNWPSESGPITTLSPACITPNILDQGHGSRVRGLLTTLYNARDNRTNKRNRESIIDMKFKRCLGIVMAMMG